MNWRTIIGDRPDLAELNVNEPFGYVGHRLYPANVVRNPSGSGIGYATVDPDGTAVTNRVDGAAVTTNLLTVSTFSYACSELIYTAGITQKQTTWMGSVEAADKRGGRAAKRGVLKCLEARRLYQAVTVTAANKIIMAATDGFFATVMQAAEKVRFYPGKRILVVGAAAWGKIIGSSEVQARLTFSATPAQEETEAIRSMRSDVVVQTMRGLLGVDEIHFADESLTPAMAQLSGVTGTTSIFGANTALVAVAPDPEEDLYYEDAQLGRSFVFIPDEEGFDITVSSFADEKTLTNNYTGLSNVDVVELNPGAKCVIDMTAWNAPQSSSSSSTSGTTGS